MNANFDVSMSPRLVIDRYRNKCVLLNFPTSNLHRANIVSVRPAIAIAFKIVSFYNGLRIEMQVAGTLLIEKCIAGYND